MKINWFKIESKHIENLIDVMIDNAFLSKRHMAIFFQYLILGKNWCKDCGKFVGNCICNYCNYCKENYCLCSFYKRIICENCGNDLNFCLCGRCEDCGNYLNFCLCKKINNFKSFIMNFIYYNLSKFQYDQIQRKL